MRVFKKTKQKALIVHKNTYSSVNYPLLQQHMRQKELRGHWNYKKEFHVIIYFSPTNKNPGIPS